MRDDFQLNVLKELANRAGNRCSNPSCNRPTSGPTSDIHGFVNIGVGAHITAAAINGPRYDPSLTAEQRSASGNGIWLCQTCSRTIDRDLTKYTKDILLIWKAGAELRAKSLIETPELPASRNEPVLYLPQTDPTISRLTFSARATKFLGREEEKTKISSFLDSPEKFAWWLVTGPAGTGKSRLALECCRGESPLWNAGFLSRTEQFNEWRRYRPTSPTLIVIDYVASHAKEASDIILQLFRSSDHFPFPIRVLLLERDQGSWWSEILRSDSPSESAEIVSCLYDNETLELNGMKPAQLSELAQEVVKSVGKTWTPSIERQFRRRMHIFDVLNRPLFGILVALHLGIGTEVSETDYSIFSEVLQKESGRRKAAISDSEKLKAFENLLILTTLVGGLLPQGGGFEFLDRTCGATFLPNLNLLDFKLHRDLASGPSNDTSLAGLQPDILGERFVLDKISLLQSYDSSFKHLLLTAWSIQPASLCDFIVRAASDFPEDNALHILCDLPTDSPEMRLYWGRLVAELVRVAGRSDSTLLQPLLAKLRNLADSYQTEDELREECARAELYLGNIFMFYEGNATAALAQFEATIIRAGTGSNMEASAINNRGILYSRMSNGKKAFKDWTDVIESKGASNEARACAFNNRADVFADQNEHEKAIIDRSSVLALTGTSPDRRFIALIRRSQSYSTMDQYDKAVDDLVDLLNTDDIASEQKAEALIQRGKIHMFFGKHQLAQQDFGEVMAFHELFPGTIEQALVCLAELCRLDGDTERAGEYVRDALESREIRRSTFIEGLIVNAKLLRDSGKTKDAESIWKIIAADPRATLEQRATAKLQAEVSKGKPLSVS